MNPTATLKFEGPWPCLHVMQQVLVWAEKLSTIIKSSLENEIVMCVWKQKWSKIMPHQAAKKDVKWFTYNWQNVTVDQCWFEVDSAEHLYEVSSNPALNINLTQFQSNSSS